MTFSRLPLRPPRIGALVCLLAAALSLPRTVDAQPLTDDDRARMHFEAGRLHFHDGAYDRALVEFQSAYDLSHRPALLVNLANANERLANYAAAMQNLREYLTVVPDAPDRDQLERRIANLERLESERLARAAEAARATQTSTAPAESDETERSRSLVGPIVAFGVGGAGFLTLAIAGPLALAKDKQLADGCGATESCSSSDVAPANRRALVADIGLGIGVAGAVVGTILFFTGRSGDDDADTASITATPFVQRGAVGMGAEVRF